MSVSIPMIGEAGAPQIDFDQLKVAKATVGIATTNDVVLSGEAVATTIFAVSAGVVVHEMLARVVTAFTDSAALTIGDTDVDGFFTAATLGATDAATAALKSSRSQLSSDDTTVAAYGNGVVFDSAANIGVTAGATFAAGQLEVYVLYSRAG